MLGFGGSASQYLQLPDDSRVEAIKESRGDLWTVQGGSAADRPTIAVHIRVAQLEQRQQHCNITRPQYCPSAVSRNPEADSSFLSHPLVTLNPVSEDMREVTSKRFHSGVPADTPNPATPYSLGVMWVCIRSRTDWSPPSGP